MKSVNYEPLSPLIFLDRAKSVYPDTIAIVGKSYKLSYKDFYENAVSIANFIKTRGCKYGDKIAFMSNNCTELLIAHYAIPLAKCILVPINSKLEEDTVIYILKNSETKILFIEKKLLTESLSNLVAYIVVIGEGEIELHNWSNVILYDSIFRTEVKNIDFFNEPYVKDETDIISINYSSGTTGVPKGVECTHRGAYLNALGECIESGLNHNSIYLWVLPMFHCNGWCFTWAVTAVGATHICCLESYDSQKIVETIIAHKVTHFCAAPTVLKMLAEAHNFHLLKGAKLTILTAGSTPTSDLLILYESMGVNMIPVYGLTETYGPITVVKESMSWSQFSELEKSRLKSCQGYASIHGTYVKVMNEHMQEVTYNGEEIGEIVMRGNNVMRGYYKDEKATEEVFRDGWFHSGDMAVVRPDGYIDVRGRSKDIIISGGENVSSVEVEKVICEHSSVFIACVIPIHDTKWGEAVHAIVQLKNGAKITEADIIAHCKSRLASFKCPKVVTFASIPVTSTGKIKKFLLKEKFEKHFS
jgi:fatty-acyl-CoA synthase